MENAQNWVLFYVNGLEVCVENPDPEMTLLYFLRNNLRLTGTKLGCGEGGCGACTVMVSYYRTEQHRVLHYSVNACLAPLCSVNGCAVTTVEGIGNTKTGVLHPCQERIARAHGSQCGFCTPGFVMSMYTLLRNNPTPTEENTEDAFGGNLCRCTGYRPILEGYKTFAKEPCCIGESGKCCMQADQPSSTTIEGPSVLFDASKFRALDPTQEPIFPAALKLQGQPKPLAIRGPRCQWYSPVTLQQLLELRDKFPHNNERGKPQHRIVVGNTEIGIEVKLKGAFYKVLISASQVPELNCMELNDEGLLVGASVSLSALASKLKELRSSLPEYKTRTFAALLEMLRWFAGQQIRNVSSIGGNICNASPISDLNPALVACGTKLNLASKESQRTILMDSNFFKGYKTTALQPNEVLVSIVIPFTREHEYIYSYKQARRREDDVAIVNAGLKVLLTPNQPHWTVRECCLAYGGVSYVTVVAKKTQEYLVGKPWCDKTLKDVFQLLLTEIQVAPDAPGGMPEFRQSLTTSFLFKFYLTVLSSLPGVVLANDLVSATLPFHRDQVKSTQGFQRVSEGQPSEDTVGRPMMHLSALQQATGEARYTDDIPHLEGELYAGLILSTHTHAKITVDYSDAVKMEGVRGYVSVCDVPGSNITGLFLDEEVFADEKVEYIGQLIGLIVAMSQPLAQRAAKAVKVTYEDLPSVITIEDAIAANSFFPPTRNIQDGDFDSAFITSEHHLQGEVRIGGQEHFYLETQGCIAVPKGEGDEMEIWCSTQAVNYTQLNAARALGVSAHRIVARVKRIGGGFGGKETGSLFLSTAVAVAANKFGVPVRIMLDRNEDMMCTGGRHPFLAKYKVGFSSRGRVTGLEVQLYANGGRSKDLTVSVMERAMTHVDNAYSIPNIRIIGRACRTNLSSNTAFRGFGGPQGMMVMEQIISHVASHLGIPTERVQELNMYRDGDVTPFGMVQAECPIRRCWDTLRKKASYEERRVMVDNYNKTNRYKKRGIALVPVKYGISIGNSVHMNQGGALLHVYTDGSVLLTHGGIEMGQGLHTKMVQVCARCLGVALERVFISETSTNTVPNSSPTVASVSTDLYGMAVKDCCDQIMERLKSIMEDDPKAGWNNWVKKAYLQRISLSVQGFYFTPGLGFDWNKGKGNLYNYFSYGVGCSEVEVDTLTGDFNVLRTDLIMDVGDSINPAIDIGQVEGAFTQGLGLFTMEQCVYLEGNKCTQRGAIFTTGPGTYKIPSRSDVPIEFNVALMDRTPNPKAIFASKAVGEPPLFLAASVFFAIKDAIAAARKERGENGPFRLDSPATCERIRMACVDQFTEQVYSVIDSDAKKWTIVS